MDEPNEAGVTRRFALECMSWAGAGLLWTVAGGVPAVPCAVPRPRPVATRDADGGQRR